MSAAEFSLVALVIGFTALVVYVYSPSRRKRLESYGEIPLDDGAAAATPSSPNPQEQRGGRDGHE